MLTARPGSFTLAELPRTCQTGLAWLAKRSSYARLPSQDHVTETRDRLHWRRRASAYTRYQRLCVSMPWWGQNGWLASLFRARSREPVIF